MDHRSVCPLEMYSVARARLNFYKSVAFYLRFETLSFSFLHWKLRIEKCLRLTIDRQCRLRLQVDLLRKNESYLILPMDVFDNLPLQFIQRPDDNENDENETFLDGILEHEINTGFTYNRSLPLWRTTLVYSESSKTFDLIMTFDHSIGDGISGMSLFTTFIDCLSERSTPSFSFENDRPVNELIPSNLPSLLSLVLGVIEKLLLPNFISRLLFQKLYWTGNKRFIDNETNQTCLVSFKLSSEILDSLHNKCRHEGATIHTAILSSLILSIVDIFGKNDLEVFCNSAVNIRRFCHPIISNNQMGVFVSSADSYHYISYREQSIDLFWPLARQIKEQINIEMEKNVLPLIQSLKFVSDWDTFLKDRRKTLPNGCQHSIDISNILRWSFESNDSSWKILHGGFTQSANVVGSAFTASVVTVNSILKVCICFQKCSFENIEQVHVMKDRMKRYLIDSINI